MKPRSKAEAERQSWYSCTRALRQCVGDQFAASELRHWSSRQLRCTACRCTSRSSAIRSPFRACLLHPECPHPSPCRRRGARLPARLWSWCELPLRRRSRASWSSRTPTNVRPGCPSRGRSSPFSAGLFLISSGVEE